MSSLSVNGVRLLVQTTGTGDVPLVLVHGSWDSHQTWEFVVPRLAEHFRVVAYDRRGHSGSERPDGPGSVRDDVADLAALIEQHAGGRAWVVGNSFGAAISLRLACERPDLLRGLVVHEPPLIGVLAGDPTAAPMLAAVAERIAAVAGRIAAGDHAGAAEQFVDTVALGPGAWAQIPPDERRTFVENAPTFLDETRDPEALAFDPSALNAFTGPVLLTFGDQSPPMFAPVVAKIAAAAPRVEVRTIVGTGHVPHLTAADAYVDMVVGFVRTHGA
jgi:pimeloyl-ACP methyl ester carboxylesterase